MAHWLPVYFIASDFPLQEPFGASFTFECTETRPSTASCARSPMCIKMSNTVCFFLFLLFQVTRGGLSFSPGHTHTHTNTLFPWLKLILIASEVFCRQIHRHASSSSSSSHLLSETSSHFISSYMWSDDWWWWSCAWDHVFVALFYVYFKRACFIRILFPCCEHAAIAPSAAAPLQ